MKIDNITRITKVLKDSAIESRLKGCSGCVGYIKSCDNCGSKIEILNGKPLTITRVHCIAVGEGESNHGPDRSKERECTKTAN